MTPEEKRLRHNENARRWREANREKWLAIARKSASKYVRNNRDKCREAKRETRRRLRKWVLAFYGGKCVRCGFSDWRALQIDHKAGDGYKDIFQAGQLMGRMRKMIRESPEECRRKYQCLCANCNWIKRFENDEHPHHEARRAAGRVISSGL